MRRIRLAVLSAVGIYGLCYTVHLIFIGNVLTAFINVFHGESQFKNRTGKSLLKNVTTQTPTTFNSYDEKIRHFKKYWTLQRDMRINYDKILAPCKNNTTWSSFYPDRNPFRITSTEHSDVILDVQPAGQYSRILINTFSVMNTRKTVGGDTWRVHVNGESSVAVTLVDNQDGSYEASFLIVEPGLYRVDLWLDYTLCDGYKDPPPEWFIKGNAQGKHQSPAVLPGNEKPFLEERYSKNLTFEVLKTNYSVYQELKPVLKDISSENSCFMWDGFGRWNNKNAWIQYIDEPLKTKAATKHRSGSGTFWIFGDSIADFLYRSVSSKLLCKKQFSQCKQTYNWVYEITDKNLTKAAKETDDKDFDVQKVVNELKRVLTNDQLDEQSVLLLNYGLHYAMDIPFETFKVMILEVINLLKEKYFKGMVIWKTTTAINKWRWGTRNSNARHGAAIRFFTTPRVELYNAYATSKMCQAGFNVLDVYPISYAYPNGTRSIVDAVHYDHVVFKPVEDYLYDYFES